MHFFFSLRRCLVASWRLGPPPWSHLSCRFLSVRLCVCTIPACQLICLGWLYVCSVYLSCLHFRVGTVSGPCLSVVIYLSTNSMSTSTTNERTVVRNQRNDAMR